MLDKDIIHENGTERRMRSQLESIHHLLQTSTWKRILRTYVDGPCTNITNIIEQLVISVDPYYKISAKMIHEKALYKLSLLPGSKETITHTWMKKQITHTWVHKDNHLYPGCLCWSFLPDANPPALSDRWTVRQSWRQNCVFPLALSPDISVTADDRRPPVKEKKRIHCLLKRIQNRTGS